MNNQHSSSDNTAEEKISNPESSASLDEKLKQSARLPDDMTREEREEHRISLAMGMLPRNSATTREDLKEALDNGRF